MRLLVEEVCDVALVDPKVPERVDLSRPFASALARRMPLMPPAEVPERMSTTKRVSTPGSRSASSSAFPVRIPHESATYLAVHRL